MRKSWWDEAWSDYLWCQAHDRRMLKKINDLIRDIERTGMATTGRPEPLSGDLAGAWSVKINEKDRLVFRIREGQLEILQCRGHYSDH